MHYVAGFTLGIIFQPAHVMEDHVFQSVEDTNTVEENLGSASVKNNLPILLTEIEFYPGLLED